MIDRDYFEHVKGRGILATADADGRVDAAVYARPHITEEGHLAFVMNDRLTHANLQSNPHAAFLFIEDRISQAPYVPSGGGGADEAPDGRLLQR